MYVLIFPFSHDFGWSFFKLVLALELRIMYLYLFQHFFLYSFFHILFTADTWNWGDWIAQQLHDN